MLSTKTIIFKRKRFSAQYRVNTPKVMVENSDLDTTKEIHVLITQNPEIIKLIKNGESIHESPE